MTTTEDLTLEKLEARVDIGIESLEIRYGAAIALKIDRLWLRGPGLVQVLGPNGAGKTTMLKAILGLIKPYRGKIMVCGEDVTGKPQRAGRCVGYVPQAMAQAIHYPITPIELVSYELRLRRVPRTLTDVENVLRLVELPEDAWRKPLRELSGGQRQRAFIARALAHDPPILLLDEPFSAVDPRGRAALAKLIGELGEKKLVIVTSHDPMLLLRYTSTILLLNRRVIAMGKPRDVLDLELLRQVYGDSVIPVERHIHISDSHAATSS